MWFCTGEIDVFEVNFWNKRVFVWRGFVFLAVFGANERKYADLAGHSCVSMSMSQRVRLLNSFFSLSSFVSLM